MKHFALRLLVATLTFCFGLMCTSQYRAFVVQRRHNQLIACERQLQNELFQKRATEIESLLNQLLPADAPVWGQYFIQGPSQEIHQQVVNRLREIANESPQSRSQVIEALIKVLEEGPEKYAFTDHRWTMAVFELRHLRATEAIDVFAKNLDQTGTMLVSLSYSPVTSAIIDIGEPAVPRLIEALADKKPGIRFQAAHALARIGQPAVAELKEVLHNGSAETKGGAALALVWIGPEGNVPIFRAIEVETDPEALSNLNDALKEWHRHWGR